MGATKSPRPLTLDVVIPVYNEQDEIGACLDLLLAQASAISHIIVVDNNSSDDTARIVRGYQRQNHCVRLLGESSQGAQYARNTGFAAATSDIIARIDADTRVSSEWAESLRRAYETHPDMQVATGATEYYDLPARRFTNFVTWFFMYASNRLIGGSIGLYGANMSIRRSAWQSIKHDVRTDPDIMEDLSIGLVLQTRGYTVAYIREAFARVSGRRMRTEPRQFARYNAKWWRTYAAYGHRYQAFGVRLFSWFGNLLQAPLAVALQHHDPRTGRFSLRRVARYEERTLP